MVSGSVYIGKGLRNAHQKSSQLCDRCFKLHMTAAQKEKWLKLLHAPEFASGKNKRCASESS